jgi:FtsP/CotA-like multicopper oxidase with cupredoxin domain
MRQRLFARRWRRTLAILGVAVLAVGALAAGGAVWLHQDAKQSNVGELAFTNRLALPELAEPTIDEDGRKVFDLRFMAGETELVDAGPTDTWGLNGTYLGPTLRAERGDRVRVNVTNDVDEATTLHWHGMHLPARMDGGPHQMIDPGERAEIVVPVDPGDEAVLRSFGPDLGMGLDERFNGGDDTFDIIQIRSAERLRESAPLPGQLATIDRPDAAEAATTRQFSLQGHRINGRSMDMERIDEVVTAGTTEVWEVTNDHGNAHSFHPHLVHFAVLDVDGNRPPPELSGWKDTIYVPPHTTIRIIARFDGEPDPDTPYMYHCHVLAHEDDGMMGQFVIVEPDDEPGDVAGADHEH